MSHQESDVEKYNTNGQKRTALLWFFKQAADCRYSEHLKQLKCLKIFLLTSQDNLHNPF